jgi:hypothetical protein
MSEHNPNLPFENGVITLCYDRDTLVSKKPISSYSDTAVFNNIPGKFFNKEACAAFRMTGFDSAAMQMILAKECVLPVKRNDRFGVIKGVIKDYDGNNLDSVKVTVDSQSVFTDKDGIFTVNITGKDQTVSKQVVVENKGYKTKTEKYLVGTNWKILMEKH